ncbi:MAG: hypothetical protein H0X33_02730 [Taibaiella sp.]|nr:hypothetical protein [Taibaiella sp.]
MRALLFAAFALLVTGSTYGQYYEVGLGGGYGTISTPEGLPKQYQGTKSDWNGLANVHFNYNFSDYWQLGGSVDMINWSRTGNWVISGPAGTTQGTKNVNYSIANPAVCVAIHGNAVVPFYSEFNPDRIKSEIYFGVSVGAVFTANDGVTSQYPDGNVQQVDLQNGKGYMIGIQAGYAYYIKRHFGFFGEIAPRYVNVRSSDAQDAHALEHYHLFNFNALVGIRYRFGYYQ